MKLKKLIILYGIFHSLLMLSGTLWVSSRQSILDAGFLFSYDWFLATFLDAYLAFLLFFFWLAWLERQVLRCLVWFFLVMLLGNIAMGIYVAWRGLQMKEDDTFLEFLTKKNDR